jgi:hypothetical protein
MCSKQMEGQERRTDERKKGGSGGWKGLSEPVGTEPVKTSTVGCRVGAVSSSVDGHLLAGLVAGGWAFTILTRGSQHIADTSVEGFRVLGAD